MPTLEDVAQAAGVSTATVSRVLNGSFKVHPKTRARVEEAIQQLRYQPNRVARRLRLRDHRAHLLGLLISDLQNPFFSDLARGVEDVAYEHGYALLVCNSDEDAEKEALYLDTMRAESVDGLILPLIEEESEALSDFIASGKAVVCVDRRPQNVGLDSVLIANEQAAYEATRHLLQLGHQRIGFLVGLAHLPTSQDRMAGYRRALAEYHCPIDEALIRVGDSRQAAAYDATGHLLDLPEPPTALFAGNNLMTLGTLEALYARQLRIPEDIALIGFDDLPWAHALNPPLTVISQPAYLMGQRAAELLLQRLQHPHRPSTQVTLPHDLIVRRSCGAKKT